jgi:uncharacterized RDD family membrane protein YckC
VKHSFTTSAGVVEVLVDEHSRVVSVYRFDADNRPIAAAIESWDHSDLADMLIRQAGVPTGEAARIAADVHERYAHLGSLAHRLEQRVWERRHEEAEVEHAGLALRFVAVLLDAVIVFFPLGLVVGLLSGGGYAESGDGYANAGVNVGGSAFWALVAIGLTYYVVCEAASGATLGKKMVGIRVVGEDGEHVTFGAAVVRNLLRVVDCLFFYLVGALFALTSARGQRLGDRAAHTVVIRR